MQRSGIVESAKLLRGASVEAALAQVDRICQSMGFARCKRLRPLLRYLVNRAVQESNGGPKEYEIGLDVFNRSPSYDPAVDPIVGVEVGRLRSKSKRYYEAGGQQDPIRIFLPTGTYAPVLELRDAAVSTARPDGAIIVVLPLRGSIGRGDRSEFADGLRDEVIAALSRVGGIRILRSTVASRFEGDTRGMREAAEEIGAAAVLEGAIRRPGGTRPHLSAIRLGFHSRPSKTRAA